MSLVRPGPAPASRGTLGADALRRVANDRGRPCGPTVSVIIPSYQRPGLARRAIHSALWQTFDELEVILVDDASGDNTEEVVAAIDDPRVRYVRHDRNRGLAAARNTGIDNAEGAYVAFLDDDDLWLPEKLEKQVGCFRAADDTLGLVHCGFMKCRMEPPYRTSIPDQAAMLAGDVLTVLLQGKAYALPSATVIPRAVIEQVGGFDEDFQREEDTDLLLRVAARYPFAFLPDPFVLYADTPHSLMRNRPLVTRMRQKLLEKHKDLYAAFPGVYAERWAALAYQHLVLGDLASARAAIDEARKVDPTRPEVRRVSRRVAYPGLWRLGKRLRGQA